MDNGKLPVKTYLICGFLGAGKTTFILEHVKDAGSNVAVLVNEFGSLGIDGATIKTRGGIDVVEMPGGCICCSQKQGLIASIKDIAEQVKPDLLLVEPSGVAEASELITTLTTPNLKNIIRLDAVITVIDATTFLEFSKPDAFGAFFLDQVENADIILVNKLDLVDTAKLEAVEKRIAEISSEALVIKTAYCRLEVAPVFARTKDKVVYYSSSSVLSSLSSLSIDPTRALSHNELELFLGKLAVGEYGEVLRAKGFLEIEGYGIVSIQMTTRTVLVNLVNWTAPLSLTVIGRNLLEDSISTYFSRTGVQVSI